jgi:parvulin-like peptidyl-prolyl isomerase
MVRLRLVAILALGMFTAMLARAEEAPAGLETIPPVVADVNGHAITREDLVRELAGTSGQAAVGRLIRRTLVEQEAENAHIKVTDDEVDAQYKIDSRDLMNELIHWSPKASKPFPLSDIIYSRFRMSVEEYKKLIVRQKIVIRRCVAQDLHPTQQQLRDFFNAYRFFFVEPTRYHAAHILITPLDPRDMHVGFRFRTTNGQMSLVESERKERTDRIKRIELYRDFNIDMSNAPSTEELGPEWIKARTMAEKVLQNIKTGVMTWDQALRQFTQDPLDQPRKDRHTGKMLPSERSLLEPPVPPGDVGWFHKDGPLVPEFYKGAKDLRPGEIGGPIKTEYGYHLIKMIDVKEPPPTQFEQVADKVERTYIEYAIQMRLLPDDPTEVGWIDRLTNNAKIEYEPVLLWPPLRVSTAIAAPVAAPAESSDGDPVVVRVNNTAIHRSDVWRELVRYESDEALARLINRDVMLSMLKPMGVARMDWECGRADLKQQVAAPEPAPIKISNELLEQDLNSDRLHWDEMNAARQHRTPPMPEMTFKEYIYQRYGQSVEEYKRSIEAGLVLLEAVRKKVTVDPETLRVQFALSRPDYADPAWFEISHILIVPTGGMAKADKPARLGARSIADQLFLQCRENADNFEQMVQTYSEDKETKARAGSLGACYADGHRDPAQLRNAADVLSSEDVRMIYSEILKTKAARGQFVFVQTTRGYHVVRVDAVHPERQVEFKEVEARLMRDYLTERAKMYSDIWLRELNNQARIKRYVGTHQSEKTEGEVRDNFPLPKE